MQEKGDPFGPPYSTQFHRLFSDINLHVMSLRFGDFRVGTTDFVFVTWIHSGCEDGCNEV